MGQEQKWSCVGGGGKDEDRRHRQGDANAHAGDSDPAALRTGAAIPLRPRPAGRGRGLAGGRVSPKDTSYCSHAAGPRLATNAAGVKATQTRAGALLRLQRGQGLGKSTAEVS